MNAVYDTEVTHVRATPLRNAFTYRSTSWFVDVDDLPRMPWYARLLGRFDARDHFTGEGTIREQVDRFLAGHGLRADRVTMLANPRVLGYVFNPLSVFWCHADGELVAVIAEVHNTYGERHAYLLETDERGRGETDKAFYVSPFYDLAGSYTMSLPEPAGSLSQVVTLHRDGEQPFVASVRGVGRPATVGNVLRATLRCPGASVGVALKIRYQGIKLWLRRLPVADRPPHDSHRATAGPVAPLEAQQPQGISA